MQQEATQEILTPEESAHAIIRQALEGAERPIVSTKFGPKSSMFMHLMTRVKPDIPIVWVDTGYNTRATLLHAERLTERLSLNLKVYRPEGYDTYVEVPALDDPGHAEFTERVKLEPFRRALTELKPDVWFSSLRSHQTAHRATLSPVQSTMMGYRKALPVLDWSEQDIQDYIEKYDLPFEDNYFDPTKGEPKRECGLHLAF